MNIPTAETSETQIGTNIRRMWESLTVSTGVKDQEAKASAQMLASALLSMMLVGILVALLDIVTTPPAVILQPIAGSVFTLTFLGIPFILARTYAYRVAFYLAILAYDLMAVMGYALNQQPYFLAYFLIPILLSAMFSSRRALVIVTAVHLALAVIIARLFSGESILDIIQSGMLPLLFISTLTFTWSQFNRDHVSRLRRQLVQQERLFQRDKDSLERQLGQQALASEQESAALQRELDTALAANREQSRHSAKEIVLAQEEERRRILRSMHDEAGQALTALAVNLAAIRDALAHKPADSPAAGDEAMERTFRQITQTMARLQLLENELQLDQQTSTDFTTDLIQFCDRAANSTALTITLTGRAPSTLDSATKVMLYRGLQEALANVVRHASATQVEVQIEPHGHGVLLAIQDNGRGYNTALALWDNSGLSLLRRQIEDLGGELAIISQPDAGTLLRVWLPATEHATSSAALPLLPLAVEQATAGAFRVLIADHQRVVAVAVSSLLQHEESFQMIGCVYDERSLLNSLIATPPDILILDPQIARSPAQLLMSVQSHHPDVNLLIFSADQEHVAALLNAGIKGYILKDDRPEALSEALRAVALGHTWWSPRLAAGLSHPVDTDNTLESLSRREGEVLQLIVDGLSNAQIAETLFISVQTVRNHVRSVYRKLNVSSRVEAVLEAMRYGMQPTSGASGNGEE